MNQEAETKAIDSIQSKVIESSSSVIPPVPDTQDQLLEVTLALIAIITLIYGLAWFLKRSKTLMPSSGIPMKTLGVLPMGVKEKIILIEVGSKQILLGMTPNNINALATFDEPILSHSEIKPSSFSSKLREILTNHSNPPNVSEFSSENTQSNSHDKAL